LCTEEKLQEEDLREYLQDPIAALPPAILTLLPKTSILLVPFLERATGRDKIPGIAAEKPAEARQLWAAHAQLKEEAILAFGVQDQDVADYHYRFFRAVAEQVADQEKPEAKSRFHGLLKEEITARAHGEVDEESWQAKQALERRDKGVRRDSKSFRTYARAAFVDTLTLYLHGICCDIDVDPGPRQLASRWLRKRLQLLKELYPPPKGYSVFPEDARTKEG
jgi:hypothetical protein